jgi:hypothetical protein
MSGDATSEPVGATRELTKLESLTRRIKWWFRDWRKNRERHRDVLRALKVLKRGTEKELREFDAPWPRNEADLLRIIRAVAKREHDYGTCVYAMSIAAEASYNYISHVLGVTGFQASCADMDFIRRTRSWKMGFQILNYENLLYPQYLDREHFPTHNDLIKENIDQLGKKAQELLAEREKAHPNIIRWWEDLVDMRRAAQ